MINYLEKLSKAGQKTVQEVKNSSEISRLNLLIQEEQDEQKKLFAQIGQQYYSLACAEDRQTDVAESILLLFSEVDKASDKIAAYQDEILKIKNVKRCPNCGRECSQDSVFCASCGTQLPKEEKAVSGSHCAKCGAELTEDDVFCFNCGNKIEK